MADNIVIPQGQSEPRQSWRTTEISSNVHIQHMLLAAGGIGDDILAALEDLVALGGSGGAQFAEDAAHVSGALGTMALAVRTDSALQRAGTDGDYSPLITDANGRLHVIEPSLADVAASLALLDNSVSGDSLRVQGDATGTGVFVQPTGANPNFNVAVASIAAGTNNIGDVDVLSLIPGTAATNLGKAIDTAAGATDTGVALLAVRDDALSTLTPVEGDYAPLRLDSAGSLWARLSFIDGGNVAVTAVVPGTAATNLGKAEDAAHASGDTGVMALAVRQATPANSSGTDGDYEPLKVSAGYLWVALGVGSAGPMKLEDVAHASGDAGMAIFGVRSDIPAALAGTTGDYQPPLLDASGRLWTRQHAGTGAQASVADTAVATTILAANSARVGASVTNDSSAVLYLLVGNGTPSTTAYTVRLVQYAYYEIPVGFTGIIQGIWASDPGDGAARVTEWI